MLESPLLSLYVHIPWCIRKCPYCDFNSHQSRDVIPEAEYLDALCEDLIAEAESINRSLEHDESGQNRKLHSIFIGGGTPSLFSANAIEKILSLAEQQLGFEADIEITLEANPGTAEAQRFRDYRSAGVNRLSLGIQSFQDDKLQALGRVHDGREAKAAIELCQQAGFDNFNLDLMHGLPEQTIDQALSDLQTALSFNPTHLSWYQLTIEPNTEFHSRPPTLPGDAFLYDMQEAGVSLLADSGYERYEVSAYAKPDKQSRHNLNYWQYGDYLGIGAGAHGKLTAAKDNRIVRARKQRQPGTYMAAQLNRVAELQDVADGDRPFEFLMNALRLRAGFTIDEFEKRTGVTFSAIAKQVEYLSAQKLLDVNGSSITTTEHGYRVLNSLLEQFL